MFCLAALAILVADLELFVKCVLLAWLITAIWLTQRFPVNRSVIALVWNADAECISLKTQEGGSYKLEHPVSLLTTPWLICLYTDPPAPLPRQWLLLLPDMVSDTEWRRLRVLSRWVRLTASDQ